MRLRSAFLALCLFPVLSAGAVEPGIDVETSVNRYSEYELTEKQIEILDEATKVSVASRMFHGLYRRWPKDVQELAARTSGIDYTIFDGKILLDEVPEGLVVTIFDSVDVRRLLATDDTPASPEVQEAARDPEFRIRIKLLAPAKDGA